MNKFDIIKELSEKKKLNEKDSHAIVSTIVDEVTQALQLGDRVEFRGFGTWSSNKQKARVSRNPKTGEKVNTPEKKNN